MLSLLVLQPAGSCHSTSLSFFLEVMAIGNQPVTKEITKKGWIPYFLILFFLISICQSSPSTIHRCPLPTMYSRPLSDLRLCYRNSLGALATLSFFSKDIKTTKRHYCSQERFSATSRSNYHLTKISIYGNKSY